MTAPKSRYSHYKKIAIFTIIALFSGLSNVFSLVQEMPTILADAPTTDYFVYVNTDGYAGGSGFVGCSSYATATNTFPPTLTPFDPTDCDLGEAINWVNHFGDSDINLALNHSLTVTIRFANNLQHINLTQNLPAITYPGRLTIDGQIDDGSPLHKVILRDNTVSADSLPTSNTLDHFFRINTPSSFFGDQELTITNFAFTALKKNTAVAITSDDSSTTTPPASNQTTIRENLESTSIHQLSITNNFFGSTNGSALDPNNLVATGIKLGIYPSGESKPVINISNNNFFNTNSPVFIGAGTLAGAFGTTPPKVCQDPLEANVSINNNTIGLSFDKTVLTSTDESNGGWVGNAIETCHLSGIDISNNTIVNNNKSGLVALLPPISNAILVTNSNGKIVDNDIGTVANHLPVQPNTLTRIQGNGITVQDNYPIDSDRKTGIYITGNQINNLATKPGLYCALSPGSRRYAPIDNESTICGGTGIVIEGSHDNWIYNNQIGSEKAPNQGYGVSIEGTWSNNTDTGVQTFKAGYQNKITANIISYNQADGIHIGTIHSMNSATTDADNLPCFSGDNHTNNCENGISQNSIFRNGTSNVSNGGGIGIDLKGYGDTEQTGASIDATSISSTNNDTDIAGSIGSHSTNGGNHMFEAPGLYGPGGSSVQRSTAEEIRGYLKSNTPVGSYWIEVFQVDCPAYRTNTGPINTLISATSNCDTDSPSSTAQASGYSYGQGKSFLCGTLVTVSSAVVTDWQCNPSSFGNASASGLVTATVAAHRSLTGGRSSYGIVNSATSINFPSPATNAGILSDRRYTCAMAMSVMINISPCDSQPVTAVPSLNNRANTYIASFIDDTSEFSNNVFIQPLVPPTFTVNKTVTACTSPLICDDSPFSSSISAHPDQLVDFRIAITNTSSTDINTQLTDTVPTNITMQDGSCIYQQDLDTATPARSDLTNGHDCSDGHPLTVNISGLQAGKTAVIFYQAVIGHTPGTEPIVNTAQVVSGGVSHDSSATITLSNSGEPSTGTTLTLDKSITTEDHIGNPSNGTLVSSNTDQTVTYRILATATGYDSATIGNLTLQDNFPRSIGSHNATYSLCHVLVSVNSSRPAPAGDINCQNAASINTTADTPLTIFNGLRVLNGLEAPAVLNPSDIIEIEVTYTSTIPANALASGASAVDLNNVARWGENAVAVGDWQHSSTTLTIQAPGTTPPTATSPTLTKLVRTCTGTTAASCQGSSFVSSLSNVPSGSTIEYRLEVNNATASVANVTIQDNQPSNITFNQTSGSCQFINSATSTLPLTGARPTTVSDCQFSGTNVHTITSIASTNHAYLFLLAQIGSAAAGSTVTNQAQLTTGCTLNCTSSAIIGVSTSPTAPSGTPIVVLTKRADNGVTTTDHSREKIYKLGDSVNYTLKLTNSGGAATGISIQDTFSELLTNVSTDPLLSGISHSVSGNVLTLGTIAVNNSLPLTIAYQGIIASKTNFDLGNFDLRKNTDPMKDDDFYLAKSTDILDEDIISTNNNHHRSKDLLGAPDGKYLSLGQDGFVTLDLGTKLIVDGTGNDFALLQLNQTADDSDQTTESLTVEVSQDGNSFKKIQPQNNESYHYDLSKVNLSWIRFIKITDTSSAVKTKAPGVDLDAVCLIHIGVQLNNRAVMTVGSQSAFASAPITVDITKAFKETPDIENCTEVSSSSIATPSVLPAPPAPSTPIAPIKTPQPVAPPTTLVKTGTLGMMGISVILALAWVVGKRKQRIAEKK